jgi:hypothetical protein
LFVETEKVALVPPRSPCLTASTNHTIQRQQRPLPSTLPRPSCHDNKIVSSCSSSSPEQTREHRSNTSIVPILRQHTRPTCTSAHTLTRRQPTELDMEDSYFSSLKGSHSGHNSVDLRRKIHGIYVLPVSPALSSSSSTTTNTDEIIKANSNTMPIRSLRHISSSINMHKQSMSHGIKNDCFADSPQPKDRTLPRSHAGTLRRLQAPAQPPPLPPMIVHHHHHHQQQQQQQQHHPHMNDVQSIIDNHNDRTSFSFQTANIDRDSDAIALRYSSHQIYTTHDDNQMKKAPPPPVPCRSQKPMVLPIGFEGLTRTSETIGFRTMLELSPQDDSSEHAWPKPPDSMSTSEISGAPAGVPPSISYDRLQHEHGISTGLTRQTNRTNFLQHHRMDGHNIFTETET